MATLHICSGFFGYEQLQYIADIKERENPLNPQEKPRVTINFDKLLKVNKYYSPNTFLEEGEQRTNKLIDISNYSAEYCKIVIKQAIANSSYPDDTITVYVVGQFISFEDMKAIVNFMLSLPLSFTFTDIKIHTWSLNKTVSIMNNTSVSPLKALEAQVLYHWDVPELFKEEWDEYIPFFTKEYPQCNFDHINHITLSDDDNPDFQAWYFNHCDVEYNLLHKLIEPREEEESQDYTILTSAPYHVEGQRCTWYGNIQNVCEDIREKYKFSELERLIVKCFNGNLSASNYLSLWDNCVTVEDKTIEGQFYRYDLYYYKCDLVKFYNYLRNIRKW